MNRLQPSRPAGGRSPTLTATDPVAALNSRSADTCQCARPAAHVNLRPARYSRAPVGSENQRGRKTAPAEGNRDRASGFCRGDRAGSAENPGISGVCARKSLIVEKSTAPARPEFAPSYPEFAPGRIFSGRTAAPFSSLSNSLKKKKKEDREGEGIGKTRCPHSQAFCPHSPRLPIFCAPNQTGAPRVIGGN